MIIPQSSATEQAGVKTRRMFGHSTYRGDGPVESPPSLELDNAREFPAMQVLRASFVIVQVKS